MSTKRPCILMQNSHCVKNVLIRSFCGTYFAAFGLNTERDTFHRVCTLKIFSQMVLLVEVSTIANLQYTTTTIRTCTKPKFLLCWIKFYYIKNRSFTETHRLILKMFWWRQAWNLSLKGINSSCPICKNYWHLFTNRQRCVIS